MLPHELLRAAATIVEAGWCSGSDAQDLEGRPIPLFYGEGRATIRNSRPCRPPRSLLIAVEPAPRSLQFRDIILSGNLKNVWGYE
jgi:hypothetical protein